MTRESDIYAVTLVTDAVAMTISVEIKYKLITQSASLTVFLVALVTDAVKKTIFLSCIDIQ